MLTTHRSYHTIIPDLFNNDPVPIDRPADFNMTAWSSRHGPSTVDPIIQLALSDLTTNANISRIGIVGYCFGGRYVARWLGNTDANIAAGYTAHPSNVQPSEWASMTAPLSLAIAENDMTFPLAESRAAEDIFRNLTIAWEAATYSDVPHGFGVRANASLPRQVFAKEQAFLQAVRWFDEFVRPEDAMDGGLRFRRPYGKQGFDDEH